MNELTTIDLSTNADVLHYITSLIPLLILGLFILFVWNAVWKGLALWHAARNGKTPWFIAFMIVNTMGILEIAFLFGVLKLKASELFQKK